MISMILRLMRFSGVRKNPRASCMVSVEPPCCFWPVVRSSITRFGEAEVVDAAVLEEAAVFDGQDRLHQVLRDLVVGDEAALGAVGVFAEAGDHYGSSS